MKLHGIRVTVSTTVRVSRWVAAVSIGGGSQNDPDNRTCRRRCQNQPGSGSCGCGCRCWRMDPDIVFVKGIHDCRDNGKHLGRDHVLRIPHNENSLLLVLLVTVVVVVIVRVVVVLWL